MSILAAINSAPIHRLGRTFELLSSRILNTFESIRETMSTSLNFKVYRDIIRSLSQPAVPFLGLVLTDLSFIEEGNADYIFTPKQLINFSKHTKTAQTINEFTKFQLSPFAITHVEEIQLFLNIRIKEYTNDNELYDLSVSIEPRERYFFYNFKRG